MQPMRVEEVRLTMPRHHLSVNEVRRIASSYIEGCIRVHPKYEPQRHFVIAVFSDDNDGIGIGNSIAMNLPNFIEFEVHALYANNFNDLDVKEGLKSAREVLESADIIIELGTYNPELASVPLKKNRLSIKVIYSEDVYHGDV